MPTNVAIRVLLVVAAVGTGLPGCADPAATSTPPPVITVTAVPATTGQTALAGTTLPRPLTVQVAADGAPRPGVTVAWQASAGAVGRTTSVTDAEGLTTSAWTLGSDTGVQTATATVAEAHGSPVVFSARALARPPEPPPTEPPPAEPPPPPDPNGVGEVYVRPEVWQVRPGESYRLRAIPQVYGFPLPDTAVTWESQHPEVATVSATGLLTGIAPGSTTITATVGTVRGTAAVTVLGPIVSVTLIPTPPAIAVGDEAFWDLEARDAGGTLMARWDAAWRSDDPGIALALLHGGIIGVQPGTAEISATVEGVTGRARVTVLAPIDLRGDWSMDETFSADGYFPCAVGGPVVLEQEGASASITGTYQRHGVCPQYQADSLDITGAVPLRGTIAGSNVSLESSSIYHCRYQGRMASDSANRVVGGVTCSGFPGTAQEGWVYDGRFTLTR